MEKLESQYNMFDWWKKVVLKNYANFKGRARRSEYWYAALCNVLFFIPIIIIGVIGASLDSSLITGFAGLLYLVLGLGVLIPGFAVAVRRMHDLDRSGTSLLFYFVPIVGPILLLIWLFSEGTRGPNKYGPDPKTPDDVVFDFEKPVAEAQL